MMPPHPFNIPDAHALALPQKEHCIVLKSLIIPTQDLVLVQRDDANQSLIELSDSEKDISILCKVVAVGPGRDTDFGMTIPPPCKVGDRVYFGRCLGPPIEFEGKRYYLLEGRQIFGIFQVPEKLKSDALEPPSAAPTLPDA